MNELKRKTQTENRLGTRCEVHGNHHPKGYSDLRRSRVLLFLPATFTTTATGRSKKEHMPRLLLQAHPVILLRLQK